MFRDRIDAGRHLARRLAPLRGRNAVVVGIARGGVLVASEVARELGCGLDVIVVQNVGVPTQPDLTMGAIGEGGVIVVNDDIVRGARVDERTRAEVFAREGIEVERRAAAFHEGWPRVPLAGRVVIVVDDGLATGATARAACRIVRDAGAARIVLAVPVAGPRWRERLGGVADDLVAVETPVRFWSTAQCYFDFTAVDDDDVLDCLGSVAT